MKDFLQSILLTLKNNGFPEKRVSLPTDKMYEVADNKGISFNDVLDALRSEHHIDSKVGPEKIIFTQGNMMKEAQEMMAKMSPEELRKIQEMFTNLSPEEKESIMKKGKDMGIL